MKWKLSLAALILMLLLGGYSIGAWMMLRGAGAYRLGTSMGQILAASWQYTALAAVLLLLILGIPRLRKLLRYGIKGSLKNDNGKEDKIPPASGTIPMVQEDKIPPASGTIPMPQEDKIPPASGTIPMVQEDKIPSASGTIPMAQEDKIPPASGTIPMMQEEKIPPASGTIPMPQEDKSPPASGTIPMVQEDKIPPASGTIPMAQKKEDDTSVCPNCGAPCGKNQKFCTRCGTRLKEENP